MTTGESSMVLLLNQDFLPFAQHLIENAKKSIWISTFKAELTTKPRGRRLNHFFSTVVDRSRDGLDVKVLLSKRENYGHVPMTNLYAVRALKEGRVRIRHPHFSQLCHAKIIIVDCTFAIIGSHNLSVKSCHSNFESSIFFDDETCVQKLTEGFDHTWTRGSKG